MNRSLSLLMTFALTCAVFATLAASCDDDDDTDDDNDSGDDDDDNDDDDPGDDDDNNDDNDNDDTTDDDTSGTWTDPASDLVWQEPPFDDSFHWQDASDYCTELELGDSDDWRLPTISELRSLVRGCPEIELAGSCEVRDDCNSWNDCFENEFCDPEGCGQGQGPGVAGVYWPADLAVWANWVLDFWSSTADSDEPDEHWLINFRFAMLMPCSPDCDVMVRCVHD